MKRMYWRPKRVSRTTLLLIALGALAGYIAVERLPQLVQEPYYREKLAAARAAEAGFKVLKKERSERGIEIESQSDPAQTGMIGAPMTPVSTNIGVLEAKQSSVNPNFAAVIVDLLMEVGVSKGDVVAVGYSGSFPAINVCVMTALETLQVRPVVITSASASTWGANHPRFTWLDMESTLIREEIITHRSVAASLGGIEDKAMGMSKQGQRMLKRSIGMHGSELITPVDFVDAVEQRMQIYRREAGTTPIRAYINVGGGTISVGRNKGKHMFRSGLNRRAPPRVPDSVMGRFVGDGIPVIHMSGIRRLAEQYGFPYPPLETPRPGSGGVFFAARYNRWLVAMVLLGILSALYLFVRSDLGFRMTHSVSRPPESAPPEPMV